jgi:dTDP-4-dehydrorhamnose 3,5-epimerase
MIFSETKLKGSFIIEIEKLEDERGFFARTWDQKKFEEMGLHSKLSQCSISFNKKAGTLRGMHYQAEPYQEAKLVHCTKGKIFDVIIDLRKNSKTQMNWFGAELSSQNYEMLYVPEGFAHGFQTLEDNTEVFYQISQEHMPEYARGKLWNDPIFNISWPIKSPIMSDKDNQWPKELS